MMKDIRTLAALIIASATFTACSSSDDSIIDDQTTNTPNAQKVYTLTIQAIKGGDASVGGDLQSPTRALSLDGHTLNATWDGTEKVKVYKRNGSTSTLIGTLSASASNTGTTTLSGTVSPAPAPTAGDELDFYYIDPKLDYTGQDGTLATIAKKHDFCGEATLSSKEYSVSDGKITTDKETTLRFGDNQQAIVKFILKDEDGNDVSATSFTIDATSDNLGRSILRQTYDRVNNTDDVEGPLSFTLSEAAHEIYAALRISGSADITITANIQGSSDTYAYRKTNVSFDNGKYYEVTIKMKKTIDLSTLTSDFTAQNGQILTGTLAGNHRIDIANGATVTLRNVTIDRPTTRKDCSGINCDEDATIILEGVNKVKSQDPDYPGILASKAVYGSNNGENTYTAYTLTIKGTGSLEVSSDNSAGIGCPASHPVGHIIIEGGTITAKGGDTGAGIGCDYGTSCASIIIKGGTVNAEGGSKAAGIGCGQYANCEMISITGGSVTAVGHGGAAGIGCGNKYDGDSSNKYCNNITIGKRVTKVVATRGDNGTNPIGASDNGTCKSVVFGDATVWNGSAWTPNPMVNGSYGGLNLTITDDGKTWTLMP